VELWVAKGDPSGLGRRKGLPGPRGDQCTFLLGKGGEEVQHEWVNVRSKLSDQEWDLVGHEAADEVNVATQAVELGHRNVASELPSHSQCGLELWSSVERVRALAGLDLDELAGHRETFGLGELRQGLPLSLYTQPRAPLLGRRDADVGD